MKKNIKYIIYLLQLIAFYGHAQINITDVSYCGPGNATFTATGGNCAGYKWYDRTGTQVATGCTYTTPLTAFDQTYTVKDPSSRTDQTIAYDFTSPGLLGFTASNTGTSNYTAKYSTTFTVTEAVTLKTIQIKYRALTANPGGNIMRVAVLNSGGLGVASTIPPLLFDGQDHILTVTLNASLSPGNYTIRLDDVGATRFVRDDRVYVHTDGADYLATGALDFSFIKITGNGLGGQSYGGVYNWVVNAPTTKVVKAIDQCANQDCSYSGNAIVSETFGSGAGIGAALPAGVTTYSYTNSIIHDGSYSITNNSSTGTPGGWLSGPDHTPNDLNGYMLLVNADVSPGEFYRSRVDNLCDNNYYIFSAWLANVLSPSSICGTAGLPVNVKFRIEDLSGNILSEHSTGNITGTPSLVWRENSLRFFLAGGQTSVYIVLINNAPGGCGNDLAIDDITFKPCRPGISIYTDAQMPTCLGETVVLNSNIPAVLTGASFQWQVSSDGLTWNNIPGATTNSFTVVSPVQGDKYRLTLTTSSSFSNCPIISNTITMLVQTCFCHQAYSIGKDTAICTSGIATLEVNYVGTTIPAANHFEIDLFRNGVLQGHYSSTAGAAAAYIPVSQAGTYTIANVSSNCPADSLSIVPGTAQVTFNPSPAPPVISPLTDVCPNSTHTYQVSDNSNPITWTATQTSNYVPSGVNNSLLTVTALTSDFHLKAVVTNSFGCKDSTEVNIHVMPTPALPLVQPVGYCLKATATALTAVGNNLTWYNVATGGLGSATAPTPTTTNAGITTYYVTQQDALGCESGRAPLTVTVWTLPVVQYTLPSSICDNASLLSLTGTPAGGLFSGTGVTGSSFNPADPAITPNSTVNLQYLYTDLHGCKDSITHAINVIAAPTVSLSIDTHRVCTGGSALLSISPYNPAYQYTWYNNSSVVAQQQNQLTTQTEGTYTVEVSNGACSATSNPQSLSVYTISVDAGGPYVVDLGNQQTIYANVHVHPYTAPYTLNWTDQNGSSFSTSTAITVLPNGDTYYVVTAVNELGCSALDTAYLEVRRELLVPHIYSPNGDGMNETWSIVNIGDYPEAIVTVYNRWGSVVFKTTHYDNTWTGERNGERLPDATYYFVIDLAAYDKKPLTGSVTIIR